MAAIVDYHMHSIYSDGVLSPTELVKRAKELGLMAISITDHDGIDGVKEGIIAGNALDIKVISGIELSVDAGNGITLHMLGYNFDPDDKELNAVITDLKEYRCKRNEKLIALLQKKGIDISFEDVLKVQGKNYIGKPNIARALQMKGYVNDWKDAFKDISLLGAPDVEELQRKRITAEQSIKLILNAGGSPVLAHPCKINKIGERDSEQFYANLDKLIRSLKIMGLKGLECYHPQQSSAESLHLVEMAEKYHLHITQGSDFHS